MRRTATRPCAPRCWTPGRSQATKCCSATSPRRSVRRARRQGRRATSRPSAPSATSRHRRFGDSPFVVEPNIKEGRGGLRDLQTLYWMARYVFGIANIFDLASTDGPARGIISPAEAQARPARLGLSLGAALPPALRRRPRRGPADLRPAAGDRRPHGLYAARTAGRRRALHAPLLPHRARGVAADACGRAGAGARGARPAGPGGGDGCRTGPRRVRARRRDAALRQGPRYPRRADHDAAHSADCARPRSHAPPAGDASIDPERASRRQPARKSRGSGDLFSTCSAAATTNDTSPMARAGSR